MRLLAEGDFCVIPPFVGVGALLTSDADRECVLDVALVACAGVDR